MDFFFMVSFINVLGTQIKNVKMRSLEIIIKSLTQRVMTMCDLECKCS